MLHRILVPLDGSYLSRGILPQVKRLLTPGLDVRIFLVLIPPSVVEGHHTRIARIHAAEQALISACNDVSALGATAEAHVVVGDPTASILEFADQYQPDLIAMFSHCRSGFGHWRWGSVTERLLRQSEHPVLVVSPSSITDRQDRNELAFKKILIPLDGSDRAEEVIPLTQKVAWLDDSEIILLYADWLQGMPKLKKGHVANKGEEYLATVGARLKKEGHQVTLKPVFGDAATAIHTFAEVEEIDLIAMTTHGRSGIPRWYYGSVAEKILRTSPCPVLVKRTVQREPRNMLPQTEEKAGRQAAAKQ